MPTTLLRLPWGRAAPASAQAGSWQALQQCRPQVSSSGHSGWAGRMEGRAGRGRSPLWEGGAFMKVAELPTCAFNVSFPPRKSIPLLWVFFSRYPRFYMSNVPFPSPYHMFSCYVCSHLHSIIGAMLLSGKSRYISHPPYNMITQHLQMHGGFHKGNAHFETFILHGKSLSLSHLDFSGLFS